MSKSKDERKVGFSPFVSVPGFVSIAGGLPSHKQKSSSFCRRSHIYGRPQRSASPRSHFKVMSSAEIANESTQLLKSWILDNSGKVSDHLDLDGVDSATRRGIYISSNRKKAVLKGTEFVILPEGTYITPKVARDALAKESCFKQILSSLDDAATVAVLLLLEQKKEDASPFAALISSLPNADAIDVPYIWTDMEMEMLKGSPLFEKARQVQSGVAEEWGLLKEKVFDKHPEMFPEDRYSLDEYMWAVAVVDSRCTAASSSEPLVLAPVLQNLGPPVEEGKPSAHTEVTGGMFFGKRKIALMCDKDLESGDEVTISYGDMVRNGDLLLERGVALSGSEYMEVEMGFELTSMDRFYEDKCDILEMYEVDRSPLFKLLSASDSGKWDEPEDMDGYLRLLCLSGGDVFMLEGVFRSDIWEHMSLPVSEENEKAVCDLVIGACEDGLERYTWKFDENADCGSGKVSRRRWELAKTVVDGEKKILNAAKGAYERRISSLDAVEYYAERRLKGLDLLRPVDESEIVDSESGGRYARAFDENY